VDSRATLSLYVLWSSLQMLQVRGVAICLCTVLVDGNAADDGDASTRSQCML